MQSTVEFLEHVLPDDGHYCFFQIENRVHRWFDRRDDLGSAILEADAQGFTVYHACASYRTPSRRTGENVQWLASFWLDIEAGPENFAAGKTPYETLTAAQVAVFQFCQETGLPPPTLVGSGGGLHVYWPLAVHLDRGSWLPLAHGLGALCRAKGLVVDPARTHDAASILRTPGTHNRKYGDVRSVIVGKFNGPYELRELDAIRAEPTRYVNGYQFEQGRIADSLQRLQDDRPSDGRLVAASCKQIRHVAETRGNVPEPHWYAALGLLSYCDAGEAIGHEWSSGYEGYTYEETQRKIEQWQAKAEGPTTCEHFAQINPQGCQGCPHAGKITSPIVLGRTQGSTGKQSVAVETGSESLAQTATQQIVLPTLPFGFAWQNRQLVASHEDAKGSAKSVLLSFYPLFLDSIQVGETRQTFNLLFKHEIPDRGVYDISISAGNLFSSQGTSLLADQGANVHDHAQFIRYVRGHVDMLHRDQKLETQYEQFGWKEDDTAFLCGLNLYTPEGVFRVPGSDELRLRSQDNQVGPAPGGSAEAWTDAVDGLFALGHEPQSAAILASFGAPLVRFLDKEEGGAVLHWTTAETGKGKSWGLIGGYTVWGKKDGLGLTNKDTKTTKGLSLGALGNLPVFYDELTNKDPSVIQEFIEIFTDGRDKLRATRSGEIRHTNTRWQTLLLSAANVSIYDVLTIGGVRRAMAARVIELGGVEMEKVDYYRGGKLKEILVANSGWAGHVYLQYLVRPDVLAHVKKLLDVTTMRLWDTGRFDNTHRYWVRALATMDVGGNIAKHIGLIRADVSGRIMPWLMEQAQEIESGDKHRANAVEVLTEYLRVHRQNTLIVARSWRQHDDTPPIQLPVHELRVRYERKERRYLIAQGPFQEWVTKRQQNYRETVKWLMKKNIITAKSRPLTIGAGTADPGVQVYCLLVDASHREISGLEPQVEDGKVIVLASPSLRA